MDGFTPTKTARSRKRKKVRIPTMDVPRPVNLPPSLESRRINALPAAAYYISDFISEEEEAAILHKVARHTRATHPRLAQHLTNPHCQG